MRILNFGSLNIDHVYRVEHLTRAGETQTAEYSRQPGGKGLNQSVALAMAGAEVYHAGLIGSGGDFLRTRLADSGVDCSFLSAVNEPSGHAVVQVDRAGENSIILFPGCNHSLRRSQIDRVLSHFGRGDLLLLQNEINEIPYLMEQAAARGMEIAFNAAPMTEAVRSYPLGLVRWLILNQTEAAALSGETEPERCAARLCEGRPRLELILTLGADGVLYRHGDMSLFIPARRVEAVDTTGAGDAFIGFFLAAVADGADPGYSLTQGTAAAALTVTRPGAADSLPSMEEVLKNP